MNGDRFPGVMSAASSGCILADNGAGAQLPDTALERMQRYLAYDNAQKGRIFTRPLGTGDLLTEAKTELATLLGTTVGRVGIGANATSIALAVSRLLATVVQRGDRIVVTASDHEANIAPWVWLRRFGAQIDVVPVDAHGDLDEAKYRAFLERAPVIVALPWASNVTGTVFDVGRYARLAKAARATVVVDGVQAFPHFALDIDPAIDFVFFSAYKMYAPHLGFWYASDAALDRFVHCDDPNVPGGDARYWTIESGTQSYEGLAGWLGTVAYLRGIDAEPRRALELIADYEEELSAYARAKFAERRAHVRLYGRPPERNRLPLFAFNVAGVPSLELAERFQRARIEARVGDFNSPRLLRSLAPETGGIAVRLSFAHYNSTEEIDRCFDVIDAAGETPAESFNESDVPERATR
ncbi:MAG: aminotransferase class V-fold PLP-dependent enzyme [Candidatus Eremiobacteraeota bacterium]|nr:aminotransferase class V-fold PLP-dependent enzyme [Candidatus Eremiobacteraeota bacterium]MBC5823086.1 aminotransferase class V-fold PLP-dependent enzyme [Candidatus Eremiobacteraeota bacterium]